MEIRHLAPGSRIVDVVVMDECIRLEGFLESELDELNEWFAGAIHGSSGIDPSFTIGIARGDFIWGSSEPAVIMTRHRAHIRKETRFLDGAEFLQHSQIRDVEILVRAAGICWHRADGVHLATTRDFALVLGRRVPPLLLADIVENWLLWRARCAGYLMTHASGWTRAGTVEMVIGDAGFGKTTELFRNISSGAHYFANDRIALRLNQNQLEARSFPEPINIGVGTIRALGLDFPTFGLDDRCAIRLLASSVNEIWSPDFASWYPVGQIFSLNQETLDRNVYWDGDPDHPFWNQALRPDELANRKDFELAISKHLALGVRGLGDVPSAVELL